MDYLDPKKQNRHRIIMLTGYVFIAIGVVIATLILLYQANGFGIGKNGKVIQRGLVFFSSQPNPASIYVNGAKNKAQTNSRVDLQAGIYKIILSREGYVDWRRTIEVDGGDVQHFDYPRLYPKQLATKTITPNATPPALFSQSPDRRWLLVQQPATLTDFSSYDLKNPTKPPTALVLPTALFSKAVGPESVLASEWSSDNKHLVLQHTYDGKTEYLLVDRENPDKSINLSTTLKISGVSLSLIDKKYDKYYLYNQTTLQLQKTNLNDATIVPVLDRVLAFKSYKDDTVLYVTDKFVGSGKVALNLLVGDTTTLMRSFPAQTTYLVDLTSYDGALYITAGAVSMNKVYIYKDPLGQLKARPKQALIPTQVLHVDSPDYLSFSNSAQFIVAEHGTQFGVYDIENKKGYNFTAQQAIDSPATHATWMDGNRLTYVSGGKQLVFDYDHTNQRLLMTANPAYLPAFTPNFKYVYVIAGTSPSNQFDLTQTALLTPADL